MACLPVVYRADARYQGKASSFSSCGLDSGIDTQEVDPYLNYLRHVMYYHDRWSSKLWGSDAFLENISQIIRKLEGLKRDTSDTRQKYLRPGRPLR